MSKNQFRDLFLLVKTKHFTAFTFKILFWINSLIPFWHIPSNSESKFWEAAQEPLFDYNKTIITLASSTFVLSFSLIKLLTLNINKNYLHISWILLFLTIMLGVILMYVRFYSKFTLPVARGKLEERLKVLDKAKFSSKIHEEIKTFEEVMPYYIILSLMHMVSFFELLFFLLAFLFLIFVAYSVI